MVHLIAALGFTVSVCCYFGSITADENHADLARALYNVLYDPGDRITLALILKDYIEINKTGAPVAWSNPIYSHYDQQLVVALQSHLNLEDSAHDHHQLQDDPISSLPVYGGLKFLTYYCGPGNWSVDGGTVQTPYFASIDQCCKHHDQCPDTIVERSDYHRYGDLPHKPQFFTRLRCSCDVEFLRCLKGIATFFSYAVAWIYTKFQSICFDHQYPVLECAVQKNDGIFSSDRCMSYLVDNSFHKRWQWFDVPYVSSNQFYFPEVQYRYNVDWFNLLLDGNR